jgi:DNA-binding CsgD family transcriptional regulator
MTEEITWLEAHRRLGRDIKIRPETIPDSVLFARRSILGRGAKTWKPNEGKFVKCTRCGNMRRKDITKACHACQAREHRNWAASRRDANQTAVIQCAREEFQMKMDEIAVLFLVDYNQIQKALHATPHFSARDEQGKEQVRRVVKKGKELYPIIRPFQRVSSGNGGVLYVGRPLKHVTEILPGTDIVLLSDREYEFLKLWLQGTPMDRIAKKFESDITVPFHLRRRVFEKFRIAGNDLAGREANLRRACVAVGLTASDEPV